MTDKREHLIRNNIFKLMMELSIPGIIGMFVISLYSFVDAFFVGKYVGNTAIGAISLAYTFTLINNGIAVLIGIGSASVLSRAVGRQDRETVDSIMGHVLILTLIFFIGNYGGRTDICTSVFKADRSRRRNAQAWNSLFEDCISGVNIRKFRTSRKYGYAR
nr:MATE family efflux transporter [Treponema pedis]